MRTKFFLILIVLSLALSACGGAATPAPSTAAPQANPPAAEPTNPPAPAATNPPAAAAPTTLRFMIVDHNDEIDQWLTQEVFPAFEQQYNAKVELIPVTWGTLDETIQGYFAAGDGADILNLGSEYVAAYGARMAPLNQYLGEAAWPDIKQYMQGALDTATWQGELRGLPWLTSPRAYVCRKDLGATPPATFEEAIQEAKQFTKVENGALTQAGFYIDNGGVILEDWQEYLELIWSLGAKLYKDNGTPNFDSPEAKAALQFMYDRRRAVLPDETTAILPELQGSRLVDGSSACVWGALWAVPPVSDPLWANLEMGASPTDPAFKGQRVIQVFNDWLAVPAYSKNQEMAANLLKVLGSAENMNRYNELSGTIPPRSDAWTGYMEDPIMKQLAELTKQYGIGFADVRETAQFRDILERELAAFMSDTQDIDTTLANIQNDYTNVLSQAGMIE
jgi:ABC-type glycerol-3-phosphate transport system substrate-binding protein